MVRSLYALALYGLCLIAINAPGQDKTRPVKAEITVTNQTSGRIELFWLSEGKEASYGKIDSKAARTQDTFKGHQWIVRNAAGKELKRFTAAGGAERIAIADNKTDKVTLTDEDKTSMDKAITVTIDLKAAYVYEFVVDNTDVPVIFSLIPPMDAKGSPKAQDGQPFTGGTTGDTPYYRCYLKTFVDFGMGGRYTLRITSTDDKKAVGNYTLNIKATVTR